MLNLSQDIHPLTDFKRNTSNFMNQMKKTRRPLVLTVNGKAELVVQDAKSYQKILDRLDRLEAVEAIRLGIAAADHGQGHASAPGTNRTAGETGHPGLTSPRRRWPVPRTAFGSSASWARILPPLKAAFAASCRPSIRGIQPACHHPPISPNRHQPLHRHVLIHIRPVNPHTPANQPPIVPLFCVRIQK